MRQRRPESRMRRLSNAYCSALCHAGGSDTSPILPKYYIVATDVYVRSCSNGPSGPFTTERVHAGRFLAGAFWERWIAPELVDPDSPATGICFRGFERHAAARTRRRCARSVDASRAPHVGASESAVGDPAEGRSKFS